MTPTQIIRIALDMSGEMQTAEARIKAAARKMRDAGEIIIEECDGGKVYLIKPAKEIT